MEAQTSLPPQAARRIMERLRRANAALASAYPGEGGERRPVQLIYGGAHLFKADVARKLGTLALKQLQDYAPDGETLARCLGLAGPLAGRIHRRVAEKLSREPVEDYRIDFEDGYGFRPDEEEDGHAAQAAAEVAKGLEAGGLPPFIGIRIKSFSPEFCERGARTLDVFATALARLAQGRLPARFMVTLPKISNPGQVDALARLLDLLEARNGCPPGFFRIELMIETTQAVLSPAGAASVGELARAARGRCAVVQFGPYDYTACCGVTSSHPMTHPASDFARHVMQVSMAGTGIALADLGTNVMPIPPHRPSPDAPPLTAAQAEQNREAVHRAWKIHYDDIRRALANGFYQGGDLHPGQLVPRYAATYAYFLGGLEPSAARLRNFVAKAARPTTTGNIFDDAATGQGLLNFFLRALYCGALTEEEVQAVTSLSVAELRSRSFAKIIAGRI